jgi:hypothetical protein
VADAGAQSYAESIQRVLFVDAGLPRPKTQVPVHAPSGELLGFLDLGWLRYLLGSEYDGEEHHDDEKDRAADERRRGRIGAATPWTVDVAGKGELWGRPAGLVARTAELLLARGWTPPNTLVLARSRARSGTRPPRASRGSGCPGAAARRVSRRLRATSTRGVGRAGFRC